MPEENDLAPVSDPVNRRWKRLIPLLVLLVGFGAGVLASHLVVPGRMHRRGSGEHGMERRAHSDSDGRPERRAGEGSERSERGRSRERGAREGEERGRRFRGELVRRLELDEAQQAQLGALITANRAEASAFWEDTYARYGELRLRLREQIREILNESQRENFDAFATRMRSRGRNEGDAGSVEGSPEGVRR